MLLLLRFAAWALWRDWKIVKKKVEGLCEGYLDPPYFVPERATTGKLASQTTLALFSQIHPSFNLICSSSTYVTRDDDNEMMIKLYR